MSNKVSTDIIDRSDAVCVIGAGPGGLSAARALLRQGLKYDQFERHSDVGGNWDPNMPEIKGTFSGEIRHSVTYKSAGEFAGKRVMIVGAGNSGADIACDAASNAKQAFISMRRGYHFIPKHVFGMPADEFGEK